MTGSCARDERVEPHPRRRRAQIHPDDGSRAEFLRDCIHWQQADGPPIGEDGLFHALDTARSLNHRSAGAFTFEEVMNEIVKVTGRVADKQRIAGERAVTHMARRHAAHQRVRAAREQDEWDAREHDATISERYRRGWPAG